MEFRERTHDDDSRLHGEAPAGGGGGDLDAMRQAAQNFLSAGDDAIDRALSGNSEAFLAANRQEGGQ